jgi:mannose-6-phosphate isomerase-like protein (cupin superfamily)
MQPQANEDTDRVLLTAILRFVDERRGSSVDGFRHAVTEWGHDWCGVAPTHLPAADLLEQMLDQTNTATHDLLSLFSRHRMSLHWEQAYSRTDNTVGDHMLANYGYAEVVGKQGPFLSTRIRAGVAVYGPGINYPLHQHEAEEIYVVLAGGAAFRLGDNEAVSLAPGSVIHHPSMMPHGLHTGTNTLVIFYLWQGGSLREKPTFV